ncbi:hypothetical protein JHK82_042649 [Glycine max]|nr:hypothetical protein JHK87_042576 [Glycine soja]KAG4949436.1 hypothetical protein JHK86_042675 [Glycine max]KAG5105679.1 hypothetical protein JHK82_042649 [Glycine max]KAG5116783.1 hypothetical protein JHK84_042896 [Glycine max]
MNFFRIWNFLRFSKGFCELANEGSNTETLPPVELLMFELIVLYVVFKLHESYTPNKVSIRAGDGFHNLKEIKTVELVKPTGWVYLSLSGADPR